MDLLSLRVRAEYTRSIVQSGLRLSLAVGAVALAISMDAALVSASAVTQRPMAAETLPALPRLDLTGYLPAVQQQVQQAYQQRPHARRRCCRKWCARNGVRRVPAVRRCSDLLRARPSSGSAFVSVALSARMGAGRAGPPPGRRADARRGARVNADDTFAKLRRAESLLTIGQLHDAGTAID